MEWVNTTTASEHDHAVEGIPWASPLGSASSLLWPGNCIWHRGRVGYTDILSTSPAIFIQKTVPFGIHDVLLCRHSSDEGAGNVCCNLLPVS